MNKKIILFVMHQLSSGGAERVVMNLANNFDREKFDIHLCLFNKTGQLVDSLKDDVVIHDLKSSRVSKGVLKFLLLLLSLKPDFVFSSIDHVNLLISIQIKLLRPILKNTKFIAREANIPSIRAKYIKASNKRDLIYRRTINSFDKVISQSKYMKEDLIKIYNINPKKIFIVSNPVDLKTIELNLQHEEKRKLLLPTEKIHILAVGALQIQKGFDILLETVPLLDDKLHLNILGSCKKTEEKEKLQKIIAQLDIADRVSLLGFHKNPYEYIEQSNLVVLSSRYEGFPNVVLEAHACGKFVVAFECPGVNSEIIENGLNGSLVECGEIKALADAINKYYKVDHDANLIKKTTIKYSVDKIVKNYERILLKQ